MRIRTFAEGIGRREATSPGYRDAAEHVEAVLNGLGFKARRQSLRVPAGVSWGVRVRAGTTTNVIGEPQGFDQRAPHLIVGAHLDTVPQSPGANDNGSGVAAVLELARLASLEPPPLPIVFIAFAAEEPRGSGDARHHYGSRAYVDAMDRAERDALVGMISLDRVAYGTVVEVCTGGRGPDTLQRTVLSNAKSLDIRATRCTSRTSDHWSFEKAGMTGVRLGGPRNPGYHSARDTMREISGSMLARVGRLTWETIKTLR